MKQRRRTAYSAAPDVDYYDDPTGADTDPDAPACWWCEERPATRNGLCASCTSTLGNSRRVAASLPLAEKRRRAHVARLAFERTGYVMVRMVRP